MSRSVISVWTHLLRDASHSAFDHATDSAMIVACPDVGMFLVELEIGHLLLDRLESRLHSLDLSRVLVSGHYDSARCRVWSIVIKRYDFRLDSIVCGDDSPSLACGKPVQGILNRVMTVIFQF